MRRLLAMAGALLLGATPSLAMTTEEKIQHYALIQALNNANITVAINDSKFCSIRDPYYGAFIPSERTVVICQQDKLSFDGKVIPFNREDLDTLRHEAHHVIQDFMDGEVDGYMRIFFDQDVLANIIAQMPSAKVERIRQIYGQWGASEHEILLELEAFAVAAQVDAGTISRAVTALCKDK